jgi:hypothetical protein
MKGKGDSVGVYEEADTKESNKRERKDSISRTNLGIEPALKGVWERET